MTKLRIISGELKGRYVTAEDGADYRPTRERVRESAAETVKQKIRGAAAADICAGSGAFGFEMISRGAASVDFVELDKRKAANILANADRLGVGGRVNVIRDDARRFVETNRSGSRNYDIIFYDPPYGSDELAGLVPDMLALLNDGGILMYERRRGRHEKKNAGIDGKENITDARIYSDTVVEFYKKDNGEDADSVISGDI